MRLILGIVLLLLGVGSLSCQLERLSADLPTPTGETEWVRTVDGWERPQNWSPSLAGPPAVHPLILATGQALFSVLALAAGTRHEPIAPGAGSAGPSDRTPRGR